GVVVVGSGEPALGKLRLLRAAGAHVRWFSRNADVAAETLTLSGQGRLEISFGDPSAAGDALDGQIAARARRHRVPVNVVDRPELSTFIFPAIVDRGEAVVAISTGGASPVLARRLRELIEAFVADADRRACRIDRSPPPPLRGGAARAVAASVLAEHHHWSRCRGGPRGAFRGGRDAPRGRVRWGRRSSPRRPRQNRNRVSGRRPAR